MSLHNAVRELADSLQKQGLGMDYPGYKDGLFDAADLMLELLDRFPLGTGHEWEMAVVFLIENGPPETREICSLCGMDRVWGDEAAVCDNRRPMDEKPEEVDDK
jgi:hypothetical protein